jgi:hypothetical protein
MTELTMAQASAVRCRVNDDDKHEGGCDELTVRKNGRARLLLAEEVKACRFRPAGECAKEF